MNDNYITTPYDVRMPKIIYGTAWKKERTASLVAEAVGRGFRGIDTACQPKHYNEPGVGDGLKAGMAGKADRKEFYIQTKFTPLNGQDPNRIPYDPNAPLSKQVEESLQRSLANLKTSYLDSLVLHSPLRTEGEMQEVWQTMEAMVDSGVVKQLGISNCYRLEVLEWLFASSRIKPAVLQNRFYANTRYDYDIRRYCGQNAIVYQGFWTLTANPQILNHPSLQTLMEKHGKTAPQIFFRYLTQIGVVPLTGTTSTTHMQEDLAIFDFELSADECGTIPI